MERKMDVFIALSLVHCYREGTDFFEPYGPVHSPYVLYAKRDMRDISHRNRNPSLAKSHSLAHDSDLLSNHIPVINDYPKSPSFPSPMCVTCINTM